MEAQGRQLRCQRSGSSKQVVDRVRARSTDKERAEFTTADTGLNVLRDAPARAKGNPTGRPGAIRSVRRAGVSVLQRSQRSEDTGDRGRSSEVERQLPKLNVVGSSPIARSRVQETHRPDGVSLHPGVVFCRASPLGPRTPSTSIR